MKSKIKGQLPFKLEQKLIIQIICCAGLFFMFNKLSLYFRLMGFLGLFYGFSFLFKPPFLSIHVYDIAVGIGGVTAVLLALGHKKKKFRYGKEYGSARWGTKNDIKPLIDAEFRNNILLSNTEFIMLGRNKVPKYNINKNVLVIGGSGSGKTRFHVKPNLMQMNASYVVTDPKGTVVMECGQLLRRGGYEIKILNTINFCDSMHYNPLNYIYSEKDILTLVNCIMENTKGEDSRGGEEFWTKAEALLYQALIGYIWYEAPDEEKNIITLLEMVNSSEVREDDEDFKNAVDMLFEQLEEKNPEHFAVRQYKKYKLAAGKTAKSILISCGARLAPFDIAEVRELMSYDELEVDKMGDRKTALFAIVSDTDKTFDFIAAMLYTQMFNVLCERALKNKKKPGRLNIHVTCLLDEFANQKIPDFQRLISVIRSREISAHIILQSQSQLKPIYKENMETIINNCDSYLFLGGKGTTAKELSETLGKETIDMVNTSDSRGSQRSSSTNYQKLGRELMTQSEIALLPGEKCIVQIRGIPPFYSDKYDIEKHPYYKYLSDFNPKNNFDVSKYLKSSRSKRLISDMKLNAEDMYEVYTVTDEDLKQGN